MSITHNESGESNGVGGSKELTNQSRGDHTVEGAVDEFGSVISPMKIAPKNWVSAEDAVRGILHKVLPTSESEEKRREVVGYIQRLIGKCLNVEVLPYGSVPLKTYLPDGDIDLTAFGAVHFEDMLVDDIKFLLQREEKNKAAPFRIKDVQVIRAEVKLIKCIVQNIVVDISFNQTGGLSTLCFLEQIDRLIGKDHLFKTSIILIKAWCYYESRILGSYHGLISTYALETLVLYIFHLYHSTLDGPLAVLYKFLDYFSKFDWETYCISLNGPIRLSSLPAIVVEMPEDSDENLLLTNDFMSYCVDKFSAPSRGGDQISRGLQQKFLNIVDPLRENNNLGRSVSKGNFYRVRSAFTYGAKKLARILMLPEKSIASELHKFFSNTMARHGSNQRPDFQDLYPSMTCNGFYPPAFEMHTSDNMHEDATRDSRLCIDNSSKTLTQGIEVSSDLLNGESVRNLALTHRFHGDADELASSGLRDLKISKGSSKSRSPRRHTQRSSDKFGYAPHQLINNSRFQNGSIMDGNQDPDKMEAEHGSRKDNLMVEKHVVVAPSNPRDFHLNHVQVSLGNGEAAESLNSLTDLTGDYDNYFRHLLYAQWFCESGMPSPHIPSPPNAPYTNNLWDGAPPPPSLFKRNGFSNQHGPAVYGMPPPMLIQGVPFGWEEGPNQLRGTGFLPHLPTMNQPPHARPLPMPMPPFFNGRNMLFLGSNMEMGSHEPSQSQVSSENKMSFGSFDGQQKFPPRGNGHLNSNGFIPELEGIPDFGSFGHSPRASMPERKQQMATSSSPRTPSEGQKSEADFGGEQDRISVTNPYHLKDEDDFPPL